MPVKRERPTAATGKPSKRAKLSTYRGVSQNKGRWVGQVRCATAIPAGSKNGPARAHLGMCLPSNSRVTARTHVSHTIALYRRS